MRTLTTEDKKHTIEIYDGVDEMLEVRYHKFTQMMVLASGVGSDMEAIVAKLGTIRQLLDDERPKEAKVEILNLYQAFYFIGEGIDPKSTAFAALVKSIDGVEYDDMTESGLEKVQERLKGFLTIGKRNETIDSVKKKIEGELEQYFPHRNDGAMEQMALMRVLMLEQLDGIIEERDVKEKVDKIAKRIRDLNEVVNYQEYEIESEKAREKSYLGIQETLHIDAKGMTVLEYETACEMLRERAKEYENKTKNKK